jgi:tetratricopeptide (TPR) repeat protein
MTSLSTFAPFVRSGLKLFCACVLALHVSSASAQQGTHPAPPPQAPTSPPPKAPTPPPSTSPPPTNFPTANNPWDQNELMQRSNNKLVSSMIADGDNCFLPPLNGLLRSSVTIADLKIPAKAQKEHKDGCAAVRNSKLLEAEGHLRKAVKQSPKYLAAWVVLGQVLQVQQKADEAYDACSQPLATDDNYLPAYLCLADISAHLERWNIVLQLSTRALEIDPANNAVAYDYNAAANFHLHRLPEAERSALRAAAIDKSNADPRVHFLLAQIYEAKGDRENEAAQLREYLKYASDPNDVAMVKRYLSELEKPNK